MVKRLLPNQSYGSGWSAALRAYFDQANQLGTITEQARIELSLGILRTKQGSWEAAREQLARCNELARSHTLLE